MADFGLNDLYAPDSELDSDTEHTAEIVLNDGMSCVVSVNDWVDVVETSIEPDPYWGYAFQIGDIDDGGNIYIKAYDSIEETYKLVQISPSLITNAFSHVVKS